MTRCFTTHPLWGPYCCSSRVRVEARGRLADAASGAAQMYPVAERFGSEPVFLVERAAAGFFGIKGYGVHVNGYVQMADGSKKMVRHVGRAVGYLSPSSAGPGS